MDPDKTQRVPMSIQLVAILIVEDDLAKDQQKMATKIAQTLITSLGRIPYIASIEAIRVVEVEPAIKTGRTQ